VCVPLFNSSKSKIFFFDPKGAPTRPIRIRSPEESPKKAHMKNTCGLKQKKGKQIYKVKSPIKQAHSAK